MKAQWDAIHSVHKACIRDGLPTQAMLHEPTCNINTMREGGLKNKNMFTMAKFSFYQRHDMKSFSKEKSTSHTPNGGAFFFLFEFRLSEHFLKHCNITSNVVAVSHLIIHCHNVTTMCDWVEQYFTGKMT